MMHGGRGTPSFTAWSVSSVSLRQIAESRSVLFPNDKIVAPSPCCGWWGCTRALAAVAWCAFSPSLCEMKVVDLRGFDLSIVHQRRPPVYRSSVTLSFMNIPQT